MTRFSLCALCVLCGSAISLRAAADPDTGRLLNSPVLARAAARAEAGRTNRMARVTHVASQSIVAGKLVSRMSDGSTVVAPIQRAHTARIPAAIDRLRSERALARIADAAAADPKPGKRAEALEAIATQIEAERAPKPEPKPKGKSKVAVLGVVATATGAAAYALRKQSQSRTTAA